MKNLRVVSIDEGIESIDASSFRNCESLSSIVFPSTLKEIDQFAFYQTSLETVNIPDNVTYLGAYSFSISTLKTVFYPASLDNVGVTCLDSTTDEFGGPFAGCSSLENLFIDEGVTSLPDSVFRDEHWDSISDSFGLKQVKFPSTLKEIGEYAFNGCANIESFIMPRSLKKIKCHNLQGAQEIYYQGSEDEWNRIDIDPSNYLYKIYYNYFYGFTDHPDDPKAYYSPMVDEKFQSNCINLLTNDANYPASLLVSHKDPKFGTKLTSFISNTVFRGIEGWEEQLLKTGSTRDAQKILLGFISESSAEVEAIATIEKTTEVANNVMTALKTFTSGKILENLNDTEILNTIANEINTSQSQSSFMNMILEGDCTKITQYFGTKTDVSSEKILNFFDSFYDSTEYLKLVDKYMKTLGYVGKISSVTSKTLANIKDLIALKEADDYYIECLEYLAANCSYQPVRNAATQLKNSVSNDYSAALFVLFDALQTGTNIGIDALIQEASLKLPPEVQLYKAALDLGITLGNELFGIKEAQEAYDKLRSAVYINKSLGEWVQEKNNAFKNSFNSNITDSIQPNAVDLIQALNLTAVARSNGEKVLQNYLDAYKFFGFPNPLKNNTLFNLSIAVHSTVKANTVHYDLANKGKKYLSLVIACPVDLSVLSADGITTLTLLDGELTQGEINSVYYFTSKNPITDDYLKSIAIPEEGNFALNIEANALGAVDYSVLSVDDRGCIRSKSFSNIPINTGDTISLYPISFSNNLTKTDAENHVETIYSPVENSGTAEIEVTSIQTSPSSVQICLDQQIRITPVLYPANASLTDVFWTIEDESIASINDQGVLTPKSAGKTKVIVHAMNGVTKSVPVEVLENSPSQTIEDEGPLGTARWTLYSNGTLKISEGEYKYAGSSANPVEWPWAKHAQKIKKIDGSAKFKFSGPMREAFNINAWHVYAPNLPSTNLSIVESIDLSGWNTNDVTTMSRMFADNPHLSSINLSGWNTSRVSNMGSMFSNCPKLRTIDTSVLDLQSAQSISGMFSGCSALQSVDVSRWNTSKILDMSMLFSDCSSLTHIDVSNWNTSNVTNMSSAFYNCSSLTSLDVSGWNTANVLNMSSLFCKCSSLSVLDVSKWNTCSAEQMFSIFGGCAALSSIDLSLWDTSSVTEVTEAFAQCKALASIRYNENARNLLPSLPLAKWYQDNQGPYSIKDLPPLKNGKTALLIKDSLSIEGASISHINASYAFTGKEITPVPIVKLNEVTLHRYTDYMITYSNNTGPGTATVTITGIGKYSGTIKITFSIVKTNTEAKRVTMHRLYNPNSGEHFYTAAENEKNFLANNGWKYEGTGWIAPESSNTPVYRLYNKNAGDHHYTMNANEKDFLVKSGWTYEGVGWYSDDGKGVPLYRQYNPNAKAGSHNYTPNKKENDFLVQNGWKAEGISWYGLK